MRARQGRRNSIITKRLFLLTDALIFACWSYLLFGKKASKLGDELWVALNSDSSVRSLKGKTRPIYSENERAYMLSCLKFVSLVFIFEDTHLANEILELKPEIYVKSGDYSLEKLNEEERISLEKVGAEIHFVPLLDGFSTTNIINTIQDTRISPNLPDK